MEEPTQSNFNVRIGQRRDADAILAIQAHWLDRGAKDERRSGYLLGGEHTPEQIAMLIDARAVSVVEHQGEVVGYYFFDAITDQYITEQNRRRVRSLTLPFARVCPRAQAAVLESFHHRGLSRMLVEELINENQARFDAVFAIVAKDNPKLAAHLRVGWQLAGEEDNFYFVVLPLNATARRAATSERASADATPPSQL